MDSPLVSICLITYNHAKFIRKAIDGALSQTTCFPWELIIADDFSTDGTRDIILEYKNQYPDKIRLILQNRNVGPSNNWLDLIRSPRGKYIAYFEGDDYWCDENRLQKQVDFLEANEYYAGCCGDVFENLDSDLHRIYGKLTVITVNDLLGGNIIYTCSVLYRNVISLPLWFAQCKMGDWILWLLIAEHGPFFSFSEPMAVYRVHNNSLWTGKGKEANLKDIIFTYDVLMTNMDEKYRGGLRLGAKQHYDLLLSILSSKRSNQIFYWLYKALRFRLDWGWFRYLFRYFMNFLNFRNGPLRSSEHKGTHIR